MVGRRGAHVHLGTADRLRKAEPHLLSMRRDTRLLADQDAVGVHERPPCTDDLPVGLAQQVEARGTVVPSIVRGKEAADVTEPCRTENGIHERMRDDVPVGVAGEAAVVVEAHAAEDERDTALEGMRVNADPDAERHGRPAGSASRESMRTAPGGGACRWPHGPRRTCTATIPAASAGSMSLSTRSPTYAILPGSTPASSPTRTKKPGCGFCTPQLAEEPTASKRGRRSDS